MTSTSHAIDLAAAYGPAPAPADWLVILPVVLCLLSGAGLVAIRRRIGWHAPIATAALSLLVLLDGMLLAKVMLHGPVTMVMGRWLPPFGIAFTVDLLGALMALAAAIVALSAALFARADIDRDCQRYGFYPLLMFLMAGVSGAFLTGDIFNLYVWFEVLLISSFGLIVLGGERIQIDGAVKYGLLNLVGTTLFLIATGYLYAIFGTLNMADLAGKIAHAPTGLPLMTLATLYLVAFAMKAAVFPLNFWLPASYHTPRIAVSALFAGLLTKVGIYAMLRVLVMLMPHQREGLAPLLALLAIVTIITGALGAIAQSDLRKMLGQWVISSIGIMLAGIAIGSQPALAATIFYALHSMVAMAALYYMAGLAARRSSGFDLNRMGGLYRLSPGLAVLALVLLFSVSGLPPFTGFWPKALLVGAALSHGHGWIASAVLFGGFLTTFAAARVFLLAFWRPATGPIDPALPPVRSSLVAITGLAALSIGFGLWPEPLMALCHRAAAGLVDPTAYVATVFGGLGR